MLSSIELLDFAQKMAAQIPCSSAYDEERRVAWLAVGLGHLKFGDLSNAQKALQNLNDTRVQARFRLEIAKWLGEHPGSEIGHRILQETVAGFSVFEPWLARNDVTDMVPAIFKTLGAGAVHSIAQQLADPFTAGNVYVMLSYQLPDVAARREQLLIAEKLATVVRDGDRDYALRWVFRGYENAGLTEDAERIRHLASQDPEELTRDEDTLFADIDKYLPKNPPDTPLDRLHRFLEYKFNDLKVIFLIDACHAGGIAHRDVEELLLSESFRRLETARPPRISSDTSSLDAHGIARFLFGRPVCRHPADRALLEGEDYCDNNLDVATFVSQMSRLFRDFGRLAGPFSPEQVEQGLWFVLGHPFWLRDMMGDSKVSMQLREECLRSMINPFRDYYLRRESSFSGSAFFMWWDSLLTCASAQDESGIEAIFIDVIQQILRLPGKQCQFAALHGLNHMHPNPIAAATVRQYLEEYRGSLTTDEAEWVEACARGTAQ